MYVCIYKNISPTKNFTAGLVGELWCVCRYVSSQVDDMHVCICAFSLYAGGPHAFVAVPGGVGIKNNTKKKHQSTNRDGWCLL